MKLIVEIFIIAKFAIANKFFNSFSAFRNSQNLTVNNFESFQRSMPEYLSDFHVFSNEDMANYDFSGDYSEEKIVEHDSKNSDLFSFMISNNVTRILPESEVSLAYQILTQRPEEVFSDLMNYLAANEALSRFYKEQFEAIQAQIDEIIENVETITKSYKTRIKMLENRDKLFYSRLQNLQRRKGR